MPRLGHDRDTDQVEDAQHDGDRVPNRGLEGHGDIPYGDHRPLASSACHAAPWSLECLQVLRRWVHHHEFDRGHEPPFPRSPHRNCRVPLQILPEAPHKTDLDEPERAVGSGTDLVVWLRVRRKLTTALRTSPLLRRHDQRPADAAATSLRHDEPSLEVRYTVAPAALGVPANRELGESDRAPCAILSEEDCERLPPVARKEAVDVFTVLGFGALGPKGAAQLEPRGSVPRLGGSNSDH